MYNSQHQAESKSNASSSGTSTPTYTAPTASYLPTTVSHAVSGLLRRFTSDTSTITTSNPQIISQRGGGQENSNPRNNGIDGVYTPPRRPISPFQPPPLYPLSLKGYSKSTAESAQLLSKAIAEEIRLLVPPRLQLCEDWNLVYSLEQDGVSLGTLYKKCDEYRGLRNGYVLVVRDGEGSLFGAYLTDPPHPSPHYYGTGECFLWRASILTPLQSLPPPPSADTTNLQRSTTIASSSSTPFSPTTSENGSLAPPTPATPGFSSNSGSSTPERIRFKAFPYSGVNDYMILCEQSFLSVGGGDGRYGLWLDDTFERGISSPCPTFGNEALSDEGEKFDILGVEIWSIGTDI